MPVNKIPTITPLSRNWTHQQIASEVMVVTHTTDNEDVQLDNIRNHINISLSDLANQLNLSASPWYRISLTATLESDVHDSGLDWINLDTPSNGIVPSQLLLDIKRLSTVSNSQSTDWVNNCTKQDISEITALRSNQNVQWRYSVTWSHTGREIIIFIGNGIKSYANTDEEDWEFYDITEQDFIIWGTRKPLVDTLLAPDDTNGNYRSNVDLPDQYINLLVKMTQKKVLEQRRESGNPVDAQLYQEVTQNVQLLQQQLMSEIQFEAAEREKRKYGAPQRYPGAV
jgi:hypothetical protein